MPRPRYSSPWASGTCCDLRARWCPQWQQAGRRSWRRRRGEEEEVWVAPLLKSRGPHLAGGEKTKLFSSWLFVFPSRLPWYDRQIFNRHFLSRFPYRGSGQEITLHERTVADTHPGITEWILGASRCARATATGRGIQTDSRHASLPLLCHRLDPHESLSKWLKTILVLHEFFVRDAHETL